MFKQLRQWQQKRRIGNVIYGIILGIVSSLIAAAIVTNYSLVVEPARKLVLANLGWLIAFGILLVAAIGTNLYRDLAWQRDREAWRNNLADLSSKLETLTTNLGWGDQLLEIVSLLLSRLPKLIAPKDLHSYDKASHSFMHDLLADATQLTTNITPGVYGASLYRPDEKKVQLTIWEAYQVSEDSRRNALCYIGPRTDIKRGVAGECFCEKTVLVAHKTNQIDKNKDWVFDRESYLHFGKPPVFESFICVPVLTVSDECLAVLCLDSSNVAAFDNIVVQKTLQQLGRIIASIIILHEDLERKHKV